MTLTTGNLNKMSVFPCLSFTRKKDNDKSGKDDDNNVLSFSVELLSRDFFLPLSYTYNCAPCITSLSVSQSVQSQSCPTLFDPMDCSTPGFPVHHHLLQLTQTQVHRAGDVIQPSHPLLSPLQGIVQDEAEKER